MEQQELSFTASWKLLVGVQNGTVTLENSLVVSYKTTHTLTILSNNYTHWYLSKGVENLRQKTNKTKKQKPAH